MFGDTELVMARGISDMSVEAADVWQLHIRVVTANAVFNTLRDDTLLMIELSFLSTTKNPAEPNLNLS
jgi:hypothetical protein